MLEAWKFSLVTGSLPQSHKVSYLKLIPKPGKDSRKISNLRPITLSNTDHKLITKSYSRRLTEVAAAVISQEQTAYIPGRLINDNVRSMIMTIDLANEEEIDGVLVSLDAKKAFDSVDHRYIRKCLVAFGLTSFVPIFDILYKELKSNIILNKKVIDGYKILKGVKQGDALSCILFIICMEPLLRNVKVNNRIEPIESTRLVIEFPKIYSFADDVNILMKRRDTSLDQLFREYEKFSEQSGLVLNAEKTEILCFNNRREHGLNFNIRYMGKAYGIKGKEELKINGILFRQDPKKREEVNVEKAIASMERLLRSWSTRHLTLIGRILILKTYGLSQLIYLMQSMTLGEASRKAVIKVIYKYLWNRNYDAAKAPERLKRSIMTAPLNCGGFGMLDLNELSDSLDLRSYGRLMTSIHPFLEQIRRLINDNDFFNVTISHPVDNKLRKSLVLVNHARRRMLHWPEDVLLTNTNFINCIRTMRLIHLLTPQGKQSVSYFLIHRRLRNATVGQVTAAELSNITRYVIYPELIPILTKLSMRHGLIFPNGNMARGELYPLLNSQKLVKVSTLSSKVFRLHLKSSEDNLICAYKIGMLLTPGEVKNWVRNKRKLTSTRHKNILLRLAHGDIFSNSRLFKFGLLEDPKCNNCDQDNETVIHRFIECPKAIAAWAKLDEAKIKLNLSPLTDLTIENLVGAGDRLDKLELTLNAELLHRLAASGGKEYCPIQVVKMAIKTIGTCECLEGEQLNRFKELIREG